MLGFILRISGSCTDPGLAAILATVKKFMNILWIIGPILAIVGAGIALFKLMNNPEEKKYKGLFKNMIIALIMLFFLPMIINVVMGMFDGQFDLASCWNQAEIINEVGSQNSNYIDPNKGNKTQITTDPNKYKGQTGTQKNTNSQGQYAASYYRNEKTRIRYNVYYQNDAKWGSVKYPSGSTINEIGCMISAIAVVVSANDSSVTPKTVFDSGHRHSYPRNAINSLSNGAFSCTAGSTSAANIKNALAGGKVVVIKVYGSKKGGSSSFTSSQHYMALLDYKDNKIFVGNGYSTGGSGLAGWFDANKVLTSVNEADYCTPTQTLLNKY
jgi:hypothetical protein